MADPNTMSITVKRLKKLLADLPDDVRICAYEGEDIGLILRWPKTEDSAWIRARDSEEDDDYTEGLTSKELL